MSEVLRQQPGLGRHDHRRHPGQGRTGPLPHSRLRQLRERHLGHLRRPDVCALHARPASRSKATARSAARKTVLGTRFAAKPIELEIPVMVTGMSYGRLVLQRQGGAGAGRAAAGTSTTTGDGGMLDGGARQVQDADLRSAAQPLRHQHPSSAAGRRHRADDRPGRQARHRRVAAGLESFRRRSPGSATCRRAWISARPARHPDLLGPGRHDHQDRGAARGDRLAGADFRQDGRHARVRRRAPGLEGRGRRRWSSTAWKAAPAPRPICCRSTPASRPWPRCAKPARPWRMSACTARCSSSSPAASATESMRPRPWRWAPTPCYIGTAR